VPQTHFRATPPPEAEPPASLPERGQVSSLLVVQFLVQETERVQNPLRWTESPSGFTAEVHGVTLELGEFQTRSGHFVSLRLRHLYDSAEIVEPLNRHFFGEKDDRRQTAELLKHLDKLATAQVAARHEEALRNRESIQQWLFRRVLLGR
jgi:hypothetical protein